jgi:hypothetical protein
MSSPVRPTPYGVVKAIWTDSLLPENIWSFLDKKIPI